MLIIIYNKVGRQIVKWFDRSHSSCRFLCVFIAILQIHNKLTKITVRKLKLFIIFDMTIFIVMFNLLLIWMIFFLSVRVLEINRAGLCTLKVWNSFKSTNFEALKIIPSLTKKKVINFLGFRTYGRYEATHNMR